MANIVISRIQNRRGRRENLPQPLLPGEVALTSDTSQAWIGQDPTLAVASINVYSGSSVPTAQDIVDDNITESRFDESFTTSDFDSLVLYLTGSGNVTLTDDDILWDSTFRGDIVTITSDGAGSGYNIGDSVTAISPTGSGFVGVVQALTGGAGTSIALVSGVNITSGGTNYRSDNTTFTIAGGGTGCTLSVATNDILGSVVHIAANPGIDANNTIANVSIDVDAYDTAAPTSKLVDHSIPGDAAIAYGGLFVDSVRLAANHTEAANVVSLINRINGTLGSVTGLVYTNLNIEITGGTNAGATVLPFEAGYYFEGIILAANALKALYVFTQEVDIAGGGDSEAYANVPSLAAVVQAYDLQKNGVSIGNITFTGTSNTGVVTIAPTAFVKGDRLEIFGPASPDGRLDQVAITLTGAITV